MFVGGCALNVSANRFLTKFNTFIPCTPGDGGSAIGCVIANKMPANAYLGFEIKKQTIIKNNNVSILTKVVL